MIDPRNDPNSAAFWQRDPDAPNYIILASGERAYLPPKY